MGGCRQIFYHLIDAELLSSYLAPLTAVSSIAPPNIRQSQQDVLYNKFAHLLWCILAFNFKTLYAEHIEKHPVNEQELKYLWQGCSSTRHRSGFLWAPPTQDTGRCSTKRYLLEFTGWWYSPSWWCTGHWLWLLFECVCWWLVYPGVPWLLMHPRCAAPPSQSPISLTQARWGCKPAINNTHPPHIPNTKLRLGRIPSLAYSPPPPPIPHPSRQKKKKTHTGLWTGLPYLQKNRTLYRVSIPKQK